jgi:hypothetical protein
MAQLSDIVGGLLIDIAKACAVVDNTTADLAAQYERHPTLKYFSAPKIEVQDISIELKVAVLQAATETVGMEVVVDNSTLQTLRESDISTIKMTISVKKFDKIS